LSEQLAKSASALVADALVADIKHGVIGDGEVLPTERQLSERFSTSRPTIRVALLSMQARGFAILETAHRAKAVKPTIGHIFHAAGENLREILGATETSAHFDQVRQFIEVGAVRRAAQDASNLQVAQIHSALDQGFQAVGDDLAFARADAAFHRAIVAVVQNPIILELHDRFVFELVASRPVNSAAVERNQMSYEEHCRIYEAIAENDPEGAMSLMDRHLSRSYRMRLSKPRKIATDVSN